MKIKFVIVFVALATAVPVFANNGTPVAKKAVDRVLSDGSKNTLSNVFFNDTEGETLFIDFEALGDQIISVNVLNGDEKVLLEDDVRDLPANVIYEINLSVFRSGTYTIELVTDQSIKIQKSIVID